MWLRVVEDDKKLGTQIDTMVKVGQFTVELVDAFTKVPFPEHTAPDGRTYVEVEPDLQYFIRVKAEYDVTGTVGIKKKVDGKSLGYKHYRYGGGWIADLGLLFETAEKSTHKALKLGKVLVRAPSDGSRSENIPAFWTGQVQVNLYELIFKAMVTHKHFSSRFEGGDVGNVVGVSDPRQSKGVKSDVGSEQITERRHTEMRKIFKNGKKLHSIKLNYCSALGLIDAGILPKPPLWEHLRTLKPAKSSDCKSITVAPKRIRLEDPNSFLAPKEYDLFDLTAVSDDDN